MAKRIKRLEKGIESLKKEIEEHFAKIETDILAPELIKEKAVKNDQN